MTWRKWWLLEIMSGLCIFAVTEPLDWKRYLLNVVLVALFSVFYLKRVQGQIAAKPSNS